MKHIKNKITTQISPFYLFTFFFFSHGLNAEVLPRDLSQRAESEKGVPVINIKKPDENGISHNLYRQFDVDKAGVVLNNSTANIESRLGGNISANPQLNTGGAKVIINEVNSSNKSILKGQMEIAGQKAHVIVANASGISCNGCGFINAERATLTTGTLKLSNTGDISFRVTNGGITIDGAGMKNGTTDYTDIISRTVKLNSALEGKNVKITTGINQVNGDNTIVKPVFSLATPDSVGIDVSALGGIYADKISLVSNKSGVGVRNAGRLLSSISDIIIDAEGNIKNAGEISSENNVTLLTQGDLDNTAGRIKSNKNILVKSNYLSNQRGVVEADKAISISTNRKRLDNSLGMISSLSDITLNSGELENSKGRIESGETLSIDTSTKNIRNRNRPSGGGLYGKNIKINTYLLDNNEGKISAQENINITSNRVNNTWAALIDSEGDLKIKADNLENSRSAITISGNADFSGVRNFDNQYGFLAIGKNLTFNGNQFINDAGFAAIKELTFKGSSFSNNSGLFMAEQANMSVNDFVNIGSHKFSDVMGKYIKLPDQSGGFVTTNADIKAKYIDNIDGVINSAGGSVNIEADKLSNQRGIISADDSLGLKIKNEISNSMGVISAKKDLEITAESLSNHTGFYDVNKNITISQPIISALNRASITISSGLVNQGVISGKKQLSINAKDITNLNGLLESESELLLRAKNGYVINKGSIVATRGNERKKGNINITARKVDNYADIFSGEMTDINADHFYGAVNSRLSSAGKNNLKIKYFSINAGALLNGVKE